MTPRPAAFVFAGLGFASAAHAFEPTQSYDATEIAGWTVRFSGAYADHPDLKAQVHAMLTNQLDIAAAVLPFPALEALADVEIWVEYDSALSAAGYHPGAQWLIDNGMNPDKARHIEISDDLLPLVAPQPAVMIHELTHAYEQRVVGYKNADLLAAYDGALALPLYADAEHVEGWSGRAYALTNESEYFAELTEAYFLYNDFEPFDRAGLQAGDPVGYALIEALWQVEN